MAITKLAIQRQCLHELNEIFKHKPNPYIIQPLFNKSHESFEIIARFFATYEFVLLEEYNWKILSILPHGDGIKMELYKRSEKL
jgi:hypothetical protein